MPVISILTPIDQHINARSEYPVLNSIIRDTKVRSPCPAKRLVDIRIYAIFSTIRRTACHLIMPVISIVSPIDKNINARSEYPVLNSIIRDRKVWLLPCVEACSPPS